MTVQDQERRGDLTPAELLDRYAMLWRIRRFEEKAFELFIAGEVKGTAHSCLGQEAVAVGACRHLGSADYVVGNHRSHGHVLAKGADLDRMMAELLGRREGYCKGLGGSMHIADLTIGIVGCNGIVGAGLPLGVGAAMSAVVRGSDQIAVVFFGDGASNQGSFHESLNMASAWQLPVVFVCENNQFALSTEWDEVRAVERIAERAHGFGVPGVTVDGNDLLAVEEVMQAAIARARSGAGPSLVECVTYRRLQHSMRANLPDPRNREVEAEWLTRDPIERFEGLLRAQGVSDGTLEATRVAVQAEIDAAVAFARAGEPARSEDADAAVYAPAPTFAAAPAPGERTITFVQALNEAMSSELERDERTILLGEDVGRVGGIFQASAGLHERFGSRRVRNTPISEGSFTGLGVGAALTGLRPIVEIQIFDFVMLAMDAIANQAAKLRFMMGGGPTIPLVIRGPQGGGFRLAAQHSQSLEAWFAHIPGLKVVAPSTPYDAKGLLTAAIRDDNPVVFLETKLLLATEGPVPVEPYAIPLGVADVKLEGTDVTVVATTSMVPHAIRAARALAEKGISVEIVDPRTLYPLDEETILRSVAKTHRCVVAHEAARFMGIGAEIAAMISEKGFFDLDAPVGRVGARHRPIPYETDLESATLPGWRDIVAAVESMP